MYLTPTKSHWACDIEADGLLEDATRIWCVCVENIVTGEAKAFTDKEDFNAWLTKDCILVGHNFISYDLPMLNRHWGAGIGISRVVDTFVLSQLYNPILGGGHSLESWGRRLKLPKGDFNDWSRYSEEMLEYCRQDTRLTASVFNKLSNRMVAYEFTELGCEIEHLSWNIIQNKQKRHGFPFDRRKAELLLADLLRRKEELENEIFTLWPPQLQVVGRYKKSHKQDGTPSALYKRHCEQFPKVILTDDGGYIAYDYVPFNLGSPKQRVEKLLELGWEPLRYTPKTDKGGGGNPKVDEESLLAFAEANKTPEAKALAKWIVVNARIVLCLKPWLNAYNEETGAIHGSIFIASTLRYRHSNPNTANIPAVRVNKNEEIQYGEEGAWAYECRDLFTSGSPDFQLVGIDAKGIQLRVLANYAYSEEFVAQVLAGDPHTNNIKTLGLANKAAAKKFLYTTLMGGQGPRLAADQAAFGTKLTPADGYRLRQRLIDSVPGFQDLIDKLEDELNKTGRIKLCDGTPILVPSPHMVIPYLLQGDESRIMKKASILLDQEIRRHKYDSHKVGDIHDEWQFKVRREHVEGFVTDALKVFPRVGKFFNYRVPIEGSAKVGDTWAETH